jgi:hypothetical protein
MIKPIASALTAVALLSASAFAVNVQDELMVSLNNEGSIIKTHQTKVQKKKSRKAPQRAVGDSYTTGGIVVTTIFEENFDNFTEGTEANPSENISDDEGNIDSKYFSTEGWSGLGVSQAGGCACLSYVEDPDEEDTFYSGTLASPAINITTPVRISMKVRGDENGFLNVIIQDSSLSYEDGWLFTIDTEWREVNFITLYNSEACQLYIFPEETADIVYIDDIKIESLGVEGTVNILDDTNVTDTSFTVNWTNDFDYYDIYAYATHTAETAETYSIINADFSKINREGTIEDPDFDEDYDDLYPDLYPYSGNYGWTLQYPKYIKGAICLNGQWSSEQDYGAIVSPALDLSNNGGKVKFSITTKGIVGEGERYNVLLLSLENGVWYRKDAKGFDATADWTTNEIELQGGGTNSVIEVIYGGSEVLAIQNMSVTQDFAAGDAITVPLEVAESIFPMTGNDDDDDDDEWDEWDEWDEYSLSRGEDDDDEIDATENPYYTFYAADKFQGDQFSYRMRGNRIVYFEPDAFEGWAYSKGITGTWTPVHYVSEKSGVANIAVNSNIKVYKSGDAITVINPDKTQINVYNTAGMQVGRSNAETATFNLPAGVYIIKTPNKVVKIAK